MKTAIIGSRSFTDYEHLKQCLSGTQIAHIYSGGAKGADSLAERYAKEFTIPITVIKPDYSSHGKAATHIRNREIVDSSDSVAAFWNGELGGTKSVIAYAEKTGKNISVHLDPEIEYFSRKLILGEPQSPERVKEIYATLNPSSHGGKELKILKRQIIEANQPKLFQLAVEERFNPEKFKHLEGKDNVFIAIPSTTGLNKFPEEMCIKLQKTFGGEFVIDGILPAHKSQAKELDGIQRVVQNRTYLVTDDSLNAEIMNGKNVVLVDDVSTTGASIDGMRQALYEKGVTVNNIVTMCQSELRLATDRDFERIAVKASSHHPEKDLSEKKRIDDLKNKLLQCFEGCLKHKLNWIERDITGNTSIRIKNREELYGVLTGEIERITRDGRNLLPVLLQKRTETGLDRGAVERAPGISDAQEQGRAAEPRQNLGRDDSGEKSGIENSVKEPRGEYANRTEKTTGSGVTRGVKTLEELFSSVKSDHSVTLPPSLKNAIDKSVSEGVMTIDNAQIIITNSIEGSKALGYSWRNNQNDDQFIAVYSRHTDTITPGDIIIKQEVNSSDKPFSAFTIIDNGQNYLGNSNNLSAIKSQVEQYLLCCEIRASINNHLSIAKNLSYELSL